MLQVSSFNLYNTQRIAFGQYTKRTKTVSNGQETTLDHKTEFFRNRPSNEFVRDYVKEKFPGGTTISLYGCSDGRTAYTDCILFDSINSDRRYRFNCYDFAQPITDAKLGLFALEDYSNNESIIFPKNTKGKVFFPDETKKKNEELRSIFYKYFDEIIPPKKYKETTIHAQSPDGHHQLLTPEQVSEYKSQVKNDRTLFVIVNPERAKNLVTFNVGNILDIEKAVKPNSSGVIKFPNAIYHLLGSRGIEDYTDFKCPVIIEELFAKIHKLLPENGIFQLGTLYSEHLVDENIKPGFKYQNNQMIEVYKDSAVHRLLKKAGFEPIFFETLESAKFYGFDNLHVPTVWKKLKR